MLYTRSEEISNIKNKANFIYMNSGIILSKLLNEKTMDDTLNHLQLILLCDSPLDKLNDVCCFLTSKNDINTIYDNNYNSSIKIIFYICNFINTSDLQEGKISLLNKLREYPKHFKCSENDLITNNQFVSYDIFSYQKKLDNI